MILEQFVAMLGIQSDTSGAKKFTDALTKVGTVAATVFTALKTVKFTDALTKVGTVAATVFTALKTVSLAAWGFFDSTIRRAEELSKVNDGSIKVTKEQVEMAKKYEEGMGKLGKIIENTKVKIAFGFLPAMLQMVNTYNEFLEANKDLIANGINKLLAVVTYASQVFTNTIRFIEKLITATIGWKGALLVLGAAFVWLKRAMLLAFITNPITWVIAAIGVLLLLIDDFMTYLDGGESQFGEFWGSMLEWIKKNQDVFMYLWEVIKNFASWFASIFVAVVSGVWGVFSGLVEYLTGVFALLVGLFTGDTELMKAAWQGMGESAIKVFSNLFNVIKAILGGIFDIASNVVKLIVNAFVNMGKLLVGVFTSLGSLIANALSGLFDIITSPFKAAFDWISDKFSGIGGLISGAINGVRSLGGAASATTNNTSSSVVNMNMNTNITAANPNQAAKAFQTAGTNMLNTAQRNQGSRVAV